MGTNTQDRHWRALEPTITLADALQRAAPPPGFTVGLAPLDELTGGIRPGDVWVVEGPAGAGTSMLVLQLAAAGVRAGRSAAVVCGHLPVPVQLARLVSQTARVHLSHLWPPDRSLDPGELERSGGARQRLATEPLRLATGIFDVAGDASAAPGLAGGGRAPDVLVVDTVAAELGHEAAPPRRLLRKLLGACRPAGTALILSHRVPGGTEVDRVGGLLLDLADVVVHLASPVGDTRPVQVRKNRWGPVGPLPDVMPQFHFARFVNGVSA